MEPSPELRDLVLRSYRALTEGDVAFLDRHTSRQPGLCVIGTEAGEQLDDYDAFRAAIVEQARAGVALLPGDPVAYRHGDVGWTADVGARVRLPDGTEVPMRVSGVLHQEAGRWTVVQTHSSLGVPNTEAFRQDVAL